MNNDAGVNHNNVGVESEEEEVEYDIEDFLGGLSLGNPPRPAIAIINATSSLEVRVHCHQPPNAAIRGENDAVMWSVALAAAVAAKALRPKYVNPTQFHRILKRREVRAKVEEYYQRRRQEAAARKPYLHESRHNHAKKRPRGPGGRFLKKDELAAYYAQHPEEDPKSCVTESDDSPPDEEKKPAAKKQKLVSKEE